MTNPMLVIKREVKAKAQDAFAAWCKPEMLIHWSFPFVDWTSTTKNDFKVGGQYTHIVTEADGSTHNHYGKYIEIVNNQKLVFTWNVLDMQDTLVTVLFNEFEGGTEIT